MEAGSTLHPDGTSSCSLPCTADWTLLRTLTSICDLPAPVVGTTTTGVSSSTESAGPTASGRSDCPLVGSMNLIFAVACATPAPEDVLKRAVACTGYGGKGDVTSLGSLIA